jgi:DNA-binding transcriptional LysR family regulator
MTHFGLDSWTFPPLAGSSVARAIPLAPRLVVNSIRAAVASAVEGHGVTRMFSYHVAREVAAGQLEILLQDDEAPALPVHLVTPQGRLAVPKVRAFVDFAVPRLRPAFARLAQR